MQKRWVIKKEAEQDIIAKLIEEVDDFTDLSEKKYLLKIKK